MSLSARPRTFGRLFLDVGAGQVAVHQSRLAAGQIAHDSLKQSNGRSLRTRASVGLAIYKRRELKRAVRLHMITTGHCLEGQKWAQGPSCWRRGTGLPHQHPPSHRLTSRKSMDTTPHLRLRRSPKHHAQWVHQERV